MMTVLWGLLAAVAVLWPARIAGPLDGAPLDHALEAIVIGVLLPWMWLAAPGLLRRRVVRILIVALLAWKAVSAAAFVPDGWCLRFTSPVPIFIDDVRVPHSWDVRADWLTDVPRCSAVMADNYPVLERFPAWFYNLPPANFRDPVRPGDRPPGATPQFDLTGFLHAANRTTFKILADEDVTLSAMVDGRHVTHDQLRGGVAIAPGDHDVRVHGHLQRTHWALDLRVDDRPMWRSAVATLSPPSALDVSARPVGRYVPAILIILLIAIAMREFMARDAIVVAAALAASAVCALGASLDRESVTRLMPLLLVVPAALAAWRRERSSWSHAVLIVLPFMAVAMALGWPRAGIFTWFSSGDDWWLFQRFSYRIYMQHHWIEGGEPAFYYQPLYRWIAGALHLVFGDSSVGELFWDFGAAAIGAAFAFQFVKIACGPRWAWPASVLTLCVFVLSPTWYFFGRGLSEMSSAGFIYAGALCAMRGRHGSLRWIAAAALCAMLAFYTRLNNAPMAMAIALFALPVRTPAAALWSPAQLWRRASKRVIAGVLLSIAVAAHLFELRAWYFTNAYDMFRGSSTRINTMWKQGESLWQSLSSSVMMLLTMHDPPAFDVRAIPLLVAALVSFMALLRVPRLGRLPLAGVGFCLAGLSTAFFFRGIGYPGRFSVHLVPISAALTVCVLSHLFDRRRTSNP